MVTSLVVPWTMEYIYGNLAVRINMQYLYPLKIKQLPMISLKIILKVKLDCLCDFESYW